MGVAGKGALGHVASRVFYLVNKPLCLCEVSAGSGRRGSDEEGKGVAEKEREGRGGGEGGKECAVCVQHLVI